MRIIHEVTGEELPEYDSARGFVFELDWACPAAYATIDNVKKFALAPEDYERVLIYHEYSAEELREQARAELAAEYERLRADLDERIEAIFSCDSLTEFLKLITDKQGRANAKRRAELRETLKRQDSDSGNAI